MRNICPVYLNLFKQHNRLHGKGSLWDAESLYVGTEVNFVSTAWSKSTQIHLLGPAEVEHGSWNGHICSINVCSCFTKGLLVKICIFFFFSSPPSKAQLFILHSFYKHVMNTDPNPAAFLEIWYSWHQISRIKVKHSLSLSSIAIMISLNGIWYFKHQKTPSRKVREHSLLLFTWWLEMFVRSFTRVGKCKYCLDLLKYERAACL